MNHQIMVVNGNKFEQKGNKLYINGNRVDQRGAVVITKEGTPSWPWFIVGLILGAGITAFCM